LSLSPNNLCASSSMHIISGFILLKAQSILFFDSGDMWLVPTSSMLYNEVIIFVKIDFVYIFLVYAEYFYNI